MKNVSILAHYNNGITQYEGLGALCTVLSEDGIDGFLIGQFDDEDLLSILKSSIKPLVKLFIEKEIYTFDEVQQNLDFVTRTALSEALVDILTE